MKRSLVLIALLALFVLSSASGRSIDASMIVTGAIVVNPDGTVQGYRLDKQDKLPPAVVGLIRHTVARWKFEPVMTDGKPTLAEASMSLRIVAHQIDEKHATAQVVGANFGCDARRQPESSECPPDQWVRPLARPKPGYPMNLSEAGVGGIVYVVLDVGKNGHVMDAAVRQVNLRARMGPHNSDVAREELSQASLAAARRWTFRVPTQGREAVKDHWVVVVPIVFNARRSDHVQYGEWMVYIPGPMRLIPWAQDHQRLTSNGSADAVPDGAVFQSDPRFVLLTPFVGASSSRADGSPANG